MNSKLKELYVAWFKFLEDKNISKELNEPQLLTVNEKIWNSDVRIMMFGKEANTNEKRFVNMIENSVAEVEAQQKAYSDYEKKIANGKADIEYFLKTRLLLCGIDDYNTNLPIEDVQKVLVNNLNKSYVKDEEDKRTDEYKKLYLPFEFDGKTQNIFMHELNILRPTHIPLVCGKGYDEHIKDNFGEDFYNKIKNHRIIAKKQDIESKLNDIIDYTFMAIKLTVKVIYAPHPSARLSGEAREAYNNLLKNFIDTK